MFGQSPPSILTRLPGEVSARWVELLAKTECPSLTARRARRAERSGASHDPIVWEEALGANVRDVDGNVFVDLTAGFGAASIGHRHPAVVAAIAAQSERLVHAFGDVHPSLPKLGLLERLAELAPFPDARVILGLNGSDAVAAAMKTAALHTKKPGVIAFDGAYHGLMYAPLSVCGYSPAFRAPFADQLNPHVRFVPYGDLAAVDAAFDETIGAVIVEPILGRGGVIEPPPDFLVGLRERCSRRGAVLIADEILTGFGRTGAQWAHGDVEIDLLCAGKALGGGMPVSACIGRAEVMAAWGDPAGEAIHTATFAGHPLGCAAALASIDVIIQEDLADRARERGARVLAMLERTRRHRAVRAVRGRGLMIAIELDEGARTLAIVRRLLEHGYIVLPAGAGAEAISITPPLTIGLDLLRGFVDVLDRLVEGS